MCFKPISLNRGTHEAPFWVSVPCGKCPECMRSRASSWSFRLEREKQNAVQSFFVTVTYDDEHLPQDGVCKEHIIKHIHKLRKEVRKFNDDLRLRYFGVSEYGDKFGRPHYHYLAFLNHRMSYIDFLTSVTLSWPFGSRFNIGTVTIASIRYCAKYCLKPKTELGWKNKTFSFMSTKPAIGSQWLTDEVKAWLNSGNGVFEYTNLDGKKTNIPRYYKDRAIDKNKRETHFLLLQHETNKETKELAESYDRGEISGETLSEHLRRKVSEQLSRQATFDRQVAHSGNVHKTAN